MKKFRPVILYFLLFVVALTGCQPASTTTESADSIKVLAVESFLADITRNVAGERAQVDSLIPLGVDPHAFEPTPQDIAKISACQVLIINGGGLEAWLEETLVNAGNHPLVIEASAGLTFREPDSNEIQPEEDEHELDPHFWLDPLLVIQYVKNIEQGLAQADPTGEQFYIQNRDAYILQLEELDAWIKEQVQQIPPGQRLLVTNHESMGYFADRYGFQVVGTVLPGVTSGVSPSAQQIADLIDLTQQYQVKAIFLEIGNNPQLAQQIAQEAGVQVVEEIYTHSLTTADGNAPTYIEMMKYNVKTIVEALKP